jgi:hypothetical protein
LENFLKICKIYSSNHYLRKKIQRTIRVKVTIVFSVLDTEYTRAICKVLELTLLLRVGTLWRCGDGLFLEVPLLASDAFLTTPHPVLENVLQTVDHFEISCLGTPFSCLEKPRMYSFGLQKELRLNEVITYTSNPFTEIKDTNGKPRFSNVPLNNIILSYTLRTEGTKIS